MIENVLSEIEWLGVNEDKPSTLFWKRTNEIPDINQKRSFLGPDSLKINSIYYAIFQPGNSSINKSFIDYPDEFYESFLVEVKIIDKKKFIFRENNTNDFIELNPDYYINFLNTWYDCLIINTSLINDLPQYLKPSKKIILPDYREHKFIQCFDFEDFLFIDSDSQGYEGKSSLFVKIKNELFLTLHTEYVLDESKTFCCNYKLRKSERDNIKDICKTGNIRKMGV